MSDKPPNILFLMSDQMGAPVLPIHGHPVCQAPHIETLAGGHATFAEFRRCFKSILRANIPAAPFLIAFVLGPLLEDNFRQSLLLSHGSLDIFVRNEICWIFWCLTVVAVVLIIRRQRKIPGAE